MPDLVSKVLVFPSTKRSRSLLVGVALFLSLSLAPPLDPPLGRAQSQSSAEVPGRGVIRLRVKPKLGNAQRSLARKRFFLIKGTLETNKELVQKIEQQSFLSRDCYYRSVGASKALIRWLQESDCESVYCREVENKDIEGNEAVPEFQQAVQAGEKQFRSREIARKWLTVNLSEELRSGYYKRQQALLQSLIKQAEELSHAKVLSVMTDRNGTAYFTDLEPGDYVLSNIIPTEFGENIELWNCDVKVKPSDLATERPFLISNRKEKIVKCVSNERPLPACP